MDQSILVEIKEKAQAYWKNDLVGVVVFGSFVKGRKYNDIDVLIVVEDIKKSRIDRVDDIVGFTGTLDIPLDVLLYSRKECADNFRNHNPLFLDITLDGKVVYDKGDFTRKLIDETARYLKERRIVRKGTAWFFPLKAHVGALSSVSNADWVRVFLEDAGRDLGAAQKLYSEGLFENSVYHSALCAEKGVKAVLMCFGAFEKTHYVSSLLKKEVVKRGLLTKDMKDLARFSKALEKHISLSRYPGLIKGKMWIPYKEYDKTKAGKFLEYAERSLLMSKKFVEEWLK